MHQVSLMKNAGPRPASLLYRLSRRRWVISRCSSYIIGARASLVPCRMMASTDAAIAFTSVPPADE
jgi:hypothetical protein